MSDEKDHLRNQLDERRRAEEDRYFEKQNRAAIEKLRQKSGGAAPGAATMRCPRDGESLVARDGDGAMIDFCPKCEGMWLDKGELEQVAQRERDSWLGRLFFGSPKT